LSGVIMLVSYPGRLPGRLKRGMILVALLTVSVTIMDAIGLALLVPLVEILIGLDNSASEISIIRWVEAVFDWLGMELSIGTLIVAILSLQSVRVIGMALQHWSTVMLSARYEEILRIESHETTLRASWLHFTSQKSGELINLMIPQAYRGGKSLHAFTTSIAGIITTLIYFSGAILISLTLSIAAAGYTVLIVLFLTYFLVRSRRIGKRITTVQSEMSVESTESIGGMKAIKAAGLEDHAAHRFRTISTQFTDIMSSSGINQGVMHSTAEVAFLIAMVLGLMFATNTLEIPSAILLLFAMLFVRLFQRAKGLQASLMGFFQTEPSLDVIYEAQRLARINVGRLGGTELRSLTSGMELTDVSFIYPGRSTGLDHVSLDIPFGKSVAIVGPSGAGKTTIIDLIVGLIDPDSGNIRVGEQSLGDVSLNSWRNNIAYVTQETALFNDTVGNNISLGHEHTDQQRLITVSEQSGVDKFISELADGYDTMISERGANLSGGQRQRIALARALYRQPQLLILDEATNALDTYSEGHFLETIDQLHGNLMILMVSHRLTTLKNVDNIYVLDQGKIVESGSPSKLMEAHTVFQTMINERSTETNSGGSPNSSSDES
jgi:ABC-type multidrug transport system fused ATPase/permease subunit